MARAASVSDGGRRGGPHSLAFLRATHVAPLEFPATPRVGAGARPGRSRARRDPSTPRRATGGRSRLGGGDREARLPAHPIRRPALSRPRLGANAALRASPPSRSGLHRIVLLERPEPWRVERARSLAYGQSLAACSPCKNSPRPTALPSSSVIDRRSVRGAWTAALPRPRPPSAPDGPRVERSGTTTPRLMPSAPSRSRVAGGTGRRGSSATSRSSGTASGSAPLIARAVAGLRPRVSTTVGVSSPAGQRHAMPAGSRVTPRTRLCPRANSSSVGQPAFVARASSSSAACDRRRRGVRLEDFTARLDHGSGSSRPC